MKQKSIQILSSLVGIVFIVSGIGKAIIAHEFSQSLTQYGFDFLRFLAPPFIVFEIALGLLLFLGIRQKLMSFIAVGLLSALSLIFLYGHFFVNVDDCGCFGYFEFLNTPPFLTILRNVVLIGISLYVFLNSDNSRKATELNEIIIIFCILCTACFVTGYKFAQPNNDIGTQLVAKNIEVKNTMLGEFLTLSNDSTYLVFAFVYSCPHCLNSIENLKQYERLGVADRVIGLSFLPDSAVIKKFDDLFNPNFEIVHLSPQELFQITNRFPVSYYIRNGIIKKEIRGVLPSGYLLLHELDRMIER